MRKISVKRIKDTIRELFLKANYELSADVMQAIKAGSRKETSKLGKEIFSQILKNAQIARKHRLPLCQDTGLAFVFLSIGQEVKISGGELRLAVNAGVKEAYRKLRKSELKDPLLRENTKTNTPAVIHTEIVPGNKIKIGVLAKGGGAENSSAMKMLLPTDSKAHIVKYVVDQVKEKGMNACPPLIIGIGLGGTFDTVGYLAKKALLRKVGRSNPRPDLAALEKTILDAVNRTGLGPMGLGGRVTALSVQIETAPCHIASLPVAVNLECHSHRYREAVI